MRRRVRDRDFRTSARESRAHRFPKPLHGLAADVEQSAARQVVEFLTAQNNQVGGGPALRVMAHRRQSDTPRPTRNSVWRRGASSSSSSDRNWVWTSSIERSTTSRVGLSPGMRSISHEMREVTDGGRAPRTASIDANGALSMPGGIGSASSARNTRCFEPDASCHRRRPSPPRCPWDRHSRTPLATPASGSQRGNADRAFWRAPCESAPFPAPVASHRT